MTGKSADHAESAGHGQLNAQRCFGVWHVAQGYDSSCCGLELWLDGGQLFFMFLIFSPLQTEIIMISLRLETIYDVNTCSFSSVHGTGFISFFDVPATWPSHLRTSKPQ